MPEQDSGSMQVYDPRTDRGQGRAKVRRDMKVIGEIIAEVEGWPDATPREIALTGRSPDVVNAHVGMMEAGGLLNVIDTIPSAGGDRYLVTDLTWQGHEFAAAIKNDTVLKKLRDGLGEEMAKLPLQVIARVSIAVAESLAKKQLGLD